MEVRIDSRFLLASAATLEEAVLALKVGFPSNTASVQSTTIL